MPSWETHWVVMPGPPLQSKKTSSKERRVYYLYHTSKYRLNPWFSKEKAGCQYGSYAQFFSHWEVSRSRSQPFWRSSVTNQSKGDVF
jgi:hypothetical protein